MFLFVLFCLYCLSTRRLVQDLSGIEITECETTAVVLDWIEQIVYKVEVNSGALTEITKIAANGVVVWVDGV